jgi:hypothetical protein
MKVSYNCFICSFLRTSSSVRHCTSSRNTCSSPSNNLIWSLLSSIKKQTVINKLQNKRTYKHPFFEPVCTATNWQKSLLRNLIKWHTCQYLVCFNAHTETTCVIKSQQDRTWILHVLGFIAKCLSSSLPLPIPFCSEQVQITNQYELWHTEVL